MESEQKELLIRAAMLTCGLFGETLEGGEWRVRTSGSAILIAPYLALTARHVLRDLFFLTQQPVPERGSFTAEHGARLFQVDPQDGGHLWNVDRSWETSMTDAALVQVSLDVTHAKGGKDYIPTGYFPWTVLPPPVGAKVWMLGYPKAQPEVRGDFLNIAFKCVLQGATVTEIYPLQRDGGMYNFPSFHVDRGVEHGFSGGAVFWNGSLCGVVSGDSLLTGGTVVASLWPLCLMDQEYPGIGNRTVGAMLDAGTIRAMDWVAAKGRISARLDERGRKAAFIIEGA